MGKSAYGYHSNPLLIGQVLVVIAAILWTLEVGETIRARMSPSPTAFIFVGLPVLVILVSTFLFRKQEFLEKSNRLLVAPLLILSSISGLLASSTGNIRATSTIADLPSLEQVASQGWYSSSVYFLQDYWHAIIFSAGVAVVIVFLAPLTFYALSIMHYVGTWIWAYLLDEEPPVRVTMLKGSNESPLRRRTLRNLLVQGVTSFNFATFIRLLLLNSIVSFLLLLALSQFGVPVDSTIMIGRYEFLLPLYVGYLGIGQLAATTILLFKEMGFKEEYKDLVKSILGILTASTLISFATSPLIREQLIDFLATIPVLYFRNSLATSFCLVALMPLTRKVIESAYSRDKITILAIFAMPFLLYWPYFSLISLRTITFDLIGVYLLFMNVIYAGGSLVAGAFIVIIWLSKRGILHDTRLWFIASAAVVCVHLVFLNLFAPVLFEGSPALIPIEILRIVWEYPGWLFGILCTFAGLGIMRIGERTRLLILTGGFLILTLYFANWILLAVSPSALACAGRRDGTARIS